MSRHVGDVGKLCNEKGREKRRIAGVVLFSGPYFLTVRRGGRK
jgi:hypothetical protein